MFSRFLGYIRDVIFASVFGTGMISDAFIVAYRIPNLFKHILGEDSVRLAFVPFFTRYLINKKNNLAYKLAVSSFKLLFLCLMIIAFLGIVFSPEIIKIIAPGFTQCFQKMELTILLTRIMFPYMIFSGAVILCMGILNVFEYYSVPAFAPVILNLFMIISIFFSMIFFSEKEKLIIGLSLGVLVGGILQLFIHVFFLSKNEIYVWKKSCIMGTELKKIGFIMLPTVFSSIAHQINILTCTLFASFLPQGAIASLYYADRIVQFPLGIFAYAFSIVLLPFLSKKMLLGCDVEVGKIFTHAFCFVLFVTIPAMAGLLVLKNPIVELLFGRGAFNSFSIELVSSALFYYTLGLWSFSGVKMVIPVFYALQDALTPMKIAFISVVLNIIFGFFFVNFMGHCGLALSTTFTSIITLVMLFYCLFKKGLVISWVSIFCTFWKTLLCSGLMFICVFYLKGFFILGSDMDWISLAIGVFVCIVLGIVFFMIFAFFLKVRELENFINLITKRYIKIF